MYTNKLLLRDDLKPAAALFKKSINAAKVHNNEVAGAFNKYGDHGPQISGVIRDHFPKNVKDSLRTLARQVSEFSDAAYAARPKGVRSDTMYKLSKAVANKYGHAFYGPQGNPIKGKKTMPKKKRSAKQLANDKRLGRMAKTRAAAKRKANPHRKKIAKRSALRKAQTAIQRSRNPKRASSKKSHLWHSFVCKGKEIYYAYITDTREARVGISKSRGKAVLFKTRQRAYDVAKLLAKHWPDHMAGVASADMTSTQIAAGCRTGK